MDTQPEKVYVVVGNDLQEGMGTLEWALRNWFSQPISIVILHVNSTSKDFVYTPFGKLPASSVSDEKLEVFRMCEQEKIDKLLSKYMVFCGKVKAEIVKIEKSEEPIQKVIVELMSRFRMTKLVMGITFMKSSSWKAKSAISGSFYVHKHKPDFCELFIICGGKLVVLKEENDVEGCAKDDQGVMVAKMREKASIKGWLGKMFTDNPANYVVPNSKKNHPPHVVPNLPDIGSPESHNRWENCTEEVENYLQWLLTSKLNEEDCEEEDGAVRFSPTELPELDHTDPNTNVSDKIETLRAKIKEAHKTIEEKRTEAKANVERQTRAEWAISVCDRRAGELDARINEEIANQIDLRKDLNATREQLYEVSSDFEESKSRLKSIVEIQSDLASKLRSSSSARAHAEAQLEKAVSTRAETLREIDELRREKDILRRRIEFCREREAIASAATSNDLNYGYREFTANELRKATDNFSEQMRLKSRGDPTNVFKGRLNHTSIAIKMQASLSHLCQDEFQAKMELLCQIRHPHLMGMIGACPELKCVVFEYMHSGSLQDALFSSHGKPRRRNPVLSWHTRIRIAAEILSGLGFLHLAKPRPIIHGNLNPSNVLLDRNLIAKIANSRFSKCYDESELQSDVCAFGVLMLQLLTGREGVGLVEEVTRAMECGSLIGVLDEMAGGWPLDLAEEFARIAMRCVYVSERRSSEIWTATVMRELEETRKKAADMVARVENVVVGEGCVDREDCRDAPSVFLCPIFQEVMKNPYVAADGFSYEMEAIEEWLGTGRGTSPMTNLKLEHKILTPNHTLRCLINDWHNRSQNAPT